MMMDNKNQHQNENVEKVEREINILLLGETGAGKSTTINALANYLTYSNFDEALCLLDSFTEVVPARFIMIDRTTQESYMISSGLVDENERHGVDNDGASVTQAPIGYTFKFSDYNLRLIDTPGVGDTGGKGEDDNNFDKIFEYLQSQKYLNAILFIMKGNQTRKTTFFKYCFTELLTRLPKSVCQNIIFCFTYSRNSNYGPGEGFVTLRSFLDKDLEVDNLKLSSGQNCFFVDNEAFRFMVAKKQNFPFTDGQESRYRESWDESVSNVAKMFKRIIELQPHELNRTVSLNLDRKNILELAQPMVEIQKTIMHNIEHIQQQQSELEKSIKNKNLLTRFLYIEVKETQAEKLKSPVNACTNKSCSKFIENDSEEPNYPICHQNCTCWFITGDKPEQKFLKYCKVFKLQKLGFGAAICRECGCSWRNHMHISVLYKTVSKKVVDSKVQSDIQTTEQAIEQSLSAIEIAEQLVREYQEEERIVKEIMTQFACILNENSVFSHYQYFEQYIDHSIKSEEGKDEPNMAQQLKQMKEDHQNSVRVFSEENTKIEKVVQTEQVTNLMKQLFDLKHSGGSFRQILETKKAVADKMQFRPLEKKIHLGAKTKSLAQMLKQMEENYEKSQI